MSPCCFSSPLASCAAAASSAHRSISWAFFADRLKALASITDDLDDRLKSVAGMKIDKLDVSKAAKILSIDKKGETQLAKILGGPSDKWAAGLDGLANSSA